MNSEVRKFVRDLTREGWTWRYRGNNHILLISPGGKTLSMASTPSDRRALKNVRAKVRKLS